MIDVAHKSLSAERTRALLRKLRDLNLSAGPIAVTSRASVEILGCTSTDVPAERGVRYRMLAADGGEATLEIRGRGDVLEISLLDAACDPLHLFVPVTCDRAGRACARALGARVDPETTEARALEHFLRRIVRSMFAARS